MKFSTIIGNAFPLSDRRCHLSADVVFDFNTTPHPPFTNSAHKKQTPLLIFSHGHHTGLVLPRKALEKELPEITRRLTGEWLEFGWGDEGFYRSEEVTFLLGFRAMTYPTPGVMHVTTSNRPLHLTYAYSPAHLFNLDAQQDKDSRSTTCPPVLPR